MSRMKLSEINWDLCCKVLNRELVWIKKELDMFLANHPDWAASYDSPLPGLEIAIRLSFWLKPERKRRNTIFHEGNEKCASIKPEEMVPVAEFVAKLVEGVNLKVKRVWPLEKHTLEYAIRIRDYSPFKKSKLLYS